MKKLVSILIIMIFFQFCGKKESEVIKVQGIVEADIITMKSAVLGSVDKVYHKIGDMVQKNTTLLTIDADKISNKLKDIEFGLKDIKLNREKLKLKNKILNEKIDYLKKQYDRLKRLNLKKAVSGEKLEKVKLGLDEAVYMKKELMKNLEALDNSEKKLLNKKDYLMLTLKDFRIISPVNGVILDRFVSEGENIFPAAPVFDIYDRDSLYIEVFLEESEIGALKLNQKVKIIIDGIKGEKLFGKIVYFGKKAEFSPKYIVSEKERKELLYLVKIKVEEHKDIYKIGMPVTVEL
jgi:HlyD family secretion protein